MKPIKFLTLLICALLFSISSVNAQDQEVVKNLTAKQKEMLQAQKELLKEQREVFKATLTKEQLAILNDKTISREQKQKNLVASLTESQKELLARNRDAIQMGKENFKATISDEQRQRLQLQIGAMNGSNNQKELRETVIERRKGRNRNN